MVRLCLYIAQAVQTKLAVATMFMMQPTIAGVADQGLSISRNADDDGHRQRRDGAVDEAADAEHDVLKVEVEEAVHAGYEACSAYMTTKARAVEHAEGGELLGVHAGTGFLYCVHKKYLRKEITRKKSSSGRNLSQAQKNYASPSIQTVLSVSESHRFGPVNEVRGLYRRSGISPCPEDSLLGCDRIIAQLPGNCKSNLAYPRTRPNSTCGSRCCLGRERKKIKNERRHWTAIRVLHISQSDIIILQPPPDVKCEDA